MNMKTVQIMLIVAAVLCAVGIAAGLSGSVELDEPKNFRPGGWLKSLGGLAGGARLAAEELERERDGGSFPAALKLNPERTARFEVEPSPENETRRVEFRIEGIPNKSMNIAYEPVARQTLNGKSVEDQHWPDEEVEDVKAPRFVVYDRGGTFIFTNGAGQQATIRMKD